MMTSPARILLLADSHLGFDLPVRPRTERRRRGHDFLANYQRALAPARSGDIDVVVHAGDVFDRPNVAASVAYQAYEPLRAIAELGIPVLVVPGNHERSRLPHRRLLAHKNIHVFDAAKTVVVNVRGADVAFSGFPYERRNVRGGFPALVEQTNWRDATTRHRVLCVHHCFEGATVGPSDYMFTTADDVIRHRDVPPDFSAVFTGHIHRHQVLRTDRHGRPIATPVLYPGSIERTAFAEAAETKGFMTVRLSLDNSAAPLAWDFLPLPARPMHRAELTATDDANLLLREVSDAIASVPDDAVLTIRVHGALTDAHWAVLSAKTLRTITPPTMNVDVVPVDAAARNQPRVREPVSSPHSYEQVQLGLF